MATNFNDLNTVLSMLKDAQKSDNDLRAHSREAHHFIDKRDGQWEPGLIKQFKNRPRYTFDKTGPIVDQIAGEMENADFTLRVRPSGGDASKDNAKIFDGLIRNIRNISNAERTFEQAGRSMVTCGVDGWEIVQDWVDSDSFEQDLIIKKIHNWLDRVWFDDNSEEQDHSDAEWCFVLSTITRREYENQFPKAEKNPASVGSNRLNDVYFQKTSDVVTLGKIYFKKRTKEELVQMSDGSIYVVDEDFQRVQDDLANPPVDPQTGQPTAAPVTEESRRTRERSRVHSRIFSGDDWLTESEETVFDLIPIVATYGNHKITENKFLFRGVVEKLIDPQRVLNYALSRDIEEGALSPRGKYWMTQEQQEGFEEELSTMNVNADPIQNYNHIEGQPPPFWNDGARPNAGLQTTAENMNGAITEGAGLFQANMGDNPGLQSGVAIDRQISKGDNSTTKWFNSQEVAICYTGRVLINAIPRVYDSTRQVRILQDDGSFEMQTLNQPTTDEATGEVIILNNLSAGQYDVTCEVGAAFKSKQREAATAFAEMAATDPALSEIARDVWFKNLDAPGFDIVSERARAIMLQQGTIPQDQWTDEELEAARAAEEAAAQEEPEEDPNLLFAQAEQAKADADMLAAQVKQQEVQGNQQNKAQELQLEAQKIQLDVDKFMREKDDKFNVEAAKIQQGQQKLEMEQQKIAMAQQKMQIDAVLANQKQQQQELTDAVNNLKTLREAMGVDAIIGPHNQEAYINQAIEVTELQEQTAGVQEIDIQVQKSDEANDSSAQAEPSTNGQSR